MPFEYVSVEEAVERSGLRMVVVGGIPSPWGEAAKGILHLKGIEWAAVRLVYDSDLLKRWAGGRSGPIAVYEDERPRAGWVEILLLAERLAPAPALVPSDPAERALMLGLAHELCGEGGLGWSRRLQLVHAGLTGGAGFPEPVAHYLAKKYGYTREVGEVAAARVASILGMLAARLEAQRAAGSPYYLGESVTALDVYSATFSGMFAPLPPEQCAMDEVTRGVFESGVDACGGAPAILLEHRDRMYAEHLELPLRL